MGKGFKSMAASALIGLGILIGTNYNLDPQKISQPVRIERKESSLEELAKTGLPQKFRDMGFRLGEYVDKETEKEIIIIAENHGSEGLLEKKKELILYLTKNQGVNSLGLEGFTGEDPDLKPSLSIGSHWNEDHFHTIRNYLLDNNAQVTIYGLENHDLLELLDSADRGIFGGPSREDLQKKTATLSHLPEGIPITGLFYDENGMRDEVKNLYGIDLKIRTREFAKNAVSHLEKNNSRRGAVIVGAWHADFPLQEIGTMLNYIPYSSLIIYGPDVTEEALKNESLNIGAQLSHVLDNLDYDSFIKKIKALKNL